MSSESKDQQRAHLVAQIARQRSDLARAYTNLAKPIQYAEYGMRGFGFLRQNPWVLSVVPAAVSIASSVIGVVRNKPLDAKAARIAKVREAEKAAAKAPKTIAGHLVKLSGHGLKLFKLYRTVRRFIP